MPYGLVEKVIARSPKGNVAICNLLYTKADGLLLPPAAGSQ